MRAEVRIERAGNRILLGSDFPTPGMKDSIPGSYFRQDGTWSVPLDLATCHLLRERFGNRLRIGPALTAWAHAEKAQRESQLATAAAEDAELKLLPERAPRLHAAMNSRKYQRAAVAFIRDGWGRDNRRRTLVGDTVGLGKTAEAIGAVLETGVPGPYLVICPKTAVTVTWAPEIRQWLGDAAEVITLPEGKSKREAVLESLAGRDLSNSWILVHPYAVRTQTWWICRAEEELLEGGESTCLARTKYKAGLVQELDCGHPKDRSTKVEDEHVFPQLFDLEYGAVIADESDQILIRLTGTPNLQRRGAEMLRDRVVEGGSRIAMSGTPFRSKPHQIWSTLNWLDPKRWSAKWAWLEKFWEVSKGGYGGSYSIGDFREDREHLLLGELSDVMIRRTREQVRGDLPPKVYPSNVQDRPDLTPGIYLPMSPEQERAYKQMSKLGEAEIEGGRLNALGVLAELTRLKQFAGAPGVLVNGEFQPKAAGNKFEWILNFLYELGFPDRPATKLVIASQFTNMLEIFAKGVNAEFKGKLEQGFVTGSNTMPQRERDIACFEDPANQLGLLWINTKAGGSAITLDAAEAMVVLDETWVDDEQQQLEGRIDNRNPERKIVPRSYYYLRSFGTVEEEIARRNAEAKARGKKLLDGASAAKLGKEMMRA